MATNSTPKVDIMRSYLLTHNETGVLKSLLRHEIKRAWDNHQHAERKFGESFRPERSLARIDFLEATFRKLGGRLEDHIVAGEQ